jgi:hypothetical protein
MDEYQIAACRTAWYPHAWEGAHPTAIAYNGLKINGEAGEIAEIIGKTWRAGGDLVHLSPRERLLVLNEVGDVQWYCATLSRELNAHLSDVAKWNLFKLAKRAELGPEGWDEDKKEEFLEEYWSEIDNMLRG